MECNAGNRCTRVRGCTGPVLLGVCQFELTFRVSSYVSLGDSRSSLLVSLENVILTMVMLGTWLLSHRSI